MQMFSVAVVGGDLRQCYLAEYLYRMGHHVTCCQTVPFSHSSDRITVSSRPEMLETADIIAGPVPFSRQPGFIYTESADSLSMEQLFSHLHAGQILAAGSPDRTTRTQCRQTGIELFDYMESETLAWTNAAFTAEGITSRIIAQTPAVLSQSPTLIIGFGRCGRLTARNLAALGCPVSICEQDPLRLAEAAACGYQIYTPSGLPDCLAGFSIILNTVPAPVLTVSCYDRLDNCMVKPCLFDLAGGPGGIDLAECQKRGITAQRCPGLPGKTAPRSAGEALGRTLLAFLTNEMSLQDFVI